MGGYRYTVISKIHPLLRVVGQPVTDPNRRMKRRKVQVSDQYAVLY